MQILLTYPSQLEYGDLAEKLTHWRHEFHFIQSGVGMSRSMFSLSEYSWDFDMVIQFGLAGTFSNELQLGDVVVVEKEIIADIEIFESGKLLDAFDLELCHKDENPFYDRQLINPYEFEEFNHLKKVRGLTVSTLFEDPAFNHLRRMKYNCDIETCEGAVLHFIGLQKEIPFVQIRAISNIVGERDKSKWKISLALNNLHQEIITFIDNLELDSEF